MGIDPALQHPVKARHHQIAVVLLGGLRHLFRRVGAQPVVAVGKLQIFPRSHGNGAVAAVRHAGIAGLVDQVKARVLFAVFPADRQTAVGAGVVHQQHLQRPPRLAGNAVQAAAQRLLRVVHRNDDRNGRPDHMLPPFFHISGASRHSTSSHSLSHKLRCFHVS